MESTLQMLIGIDKKNPLFSLFENQSDNTLHIFMGATLFDVVSNDRSNPEFKLLLTRLYVAKVNRKALFDTFGIHISTIRRWSAALRSGDSNKLIQALSGAGAPKKLTAEIRSFVRVRFLRIYQTNHYTYSSIILQEIREVFKVNLSSETLRTIFNDLKKGFQEDANTKRANTCDLESNHHLSNEELSFKTEPVSDFEEVCEKEISSEIFDNRKHSLFFPNRKMPKSSGYAHHVGILIFSPFLEQAFELLTIEKEFIIQWIILSLLGIHNIEQSKNIDFDSLEVMFGKIISTLQLQRNKLSELSSNPNIIENLVQVNANLVSLSNETDFYYDPHTKKYTGEDNVLKGWCGSIGKTSKALHMDFIHTSSGYPVYVEHFDNYSDLRERFLPTIDAFREKSNIAKITVLTIVVDRGIYSMDIFNKFINRKYYHLITWEKGYKQDQWDDSLKIEEHIYFRNRNSEDNYFKYTFSFIEKKWNKNKNIRQLIVRATNHKDTTIEVSVVTDDFTRNGKEVILLIFKRWVQENDFKFLMKHFGINELISRSSISYKDLVQNETDKEVLSGEYKAYKQEQNRVTNELKKLLLKMELQKFTQKKQSENKQNVILLKTKLAELELNKTRTKGKVSKLSVLADNNYFRLKTNKKLIMDMIKIISRNIFYLAIQPFKRKYNNYRDDHVLFRSLSRSDGYILKASDNITVILNPTNRFPPKLQKIIHEYLNNINSDGIGFSDYENTNFKLILGDKRSKLFAIQEWQNDSK